MAARMETRAPTAGPAMPDEATLAPAQRAAHDAARHCHVVVLEALRTLLREGSVPGARVTLLVDTADICRTAADFLQRGSQLYAPVCRACAAVCRACQWECERHDAEGMRACIDACARCAEACERIAA